MAKMTIAQLREVALDRFNEDYIKDFDKARNFVNRFYRLAGLDERCLYYDNDENLYNKYWVQKAHEKADKMLDKLRADLKPFGLTIRYYGYLPTLEEIGTQNRALTAWYYER